MKILFVISCLSIEDGGPIVFVESLARHLASIGHKVDILTCDYPERGFSYSHTALIDKLTDCGVNVFSFRVNNEYRFSLSLLQWAMANFSLYDVIHNNAIYRFPVDITFVLARYLRVPVVFSPHGSYDKFLSMRSQFGGVGLILKRLHRFFLKAFIDSAVLHITASDELNASSIAYKQRLQFIIPIGVEPADKVQQEIPSLRSRLGIPINSFLIIHIGRNDRKKNLVSWYCSRVPQ